MERIADRGPIVDVDAHHYENQCFGLNTRRLNTRDTRDNRRSRSC